MNILQLCHKPPYPSKDGGSIATSTLTQGYADFGHRVFILAMNTPKHFTNETTIEASLPEHASIRLINTDTRVHLVKALVNFFFSRKAYHVVRFYSEAFEEALSELMQRQ